jgi:chromosome segregation ATPase
MAAALWVQATEQAQQGIADARRELEQQRTTLEAQRQEAVEAADALAAQLADTRQELETARKGLEALRTELATTREKLAGATERTQQAERQAAEAKDAEMAARVEAAGLRGRLEGMEALHQAQTAAPEQSQGRGKGKAPIQGSLDVGS